MFFRALAGVCLLSTLLAGPALADPQAGKTSPTLSAPTIQGLDLSMVLEVRDAQGRPQTRLEVPRDSTPKMWALVHNTGSQSSTPCRVLYFVLGPAERSLPGFQPVVYTVDVPALRPGQKLELDLARILRDDKHFWVGALIGVQDGEKWKDSNPANDRSKREVLLVPAK